MFEILSTCKGGGYLYCRTNPEHPNRNSNGLYPLHRVLASNKIGRLLTPDEDVHHIDGDKTNNSECNIQVMSRSDHARLHANDRAPELSVVTCSFCKNEFTINSLICRRRKNRNKNGNAFCSRSCGAKHQHKMKP